MKGSQLYILKKDLSFYQATNYALLFFNVTLKSNIIKKLEDKTCQRAINKSINKVGTSCL